MQGLTWVTEMIRLALGPVLGAHGQLPPTMYGDDLGSLDRGSWLAFERLLVANDRCAVRTRVQTFHSAGSLPAVCKARLHGPIAAMLQLG